MKRIMVLGVILSSLVLILAGCSNDSASSTIPVEPRINEEKAVALATLWIPPEVVPKALVAARLFQLPADATEELKQSWPPLELGRDYWLVVFSINNLTNEQLHWQEDQGVELGPGGVYQTLEIYIDADTGDTAFRKASKGIQLGGPIPEPTKVIRVVNTSVIIGWIATAILAVIITSYLVLKHRKGSPG